jgi:hypothetical protein
MATLKALVTRVGQGLALRMKSDLGFFEKPKIVAFPVGKCSANNLLAFLVYQHLAF